jgi:hypothetical protein
MHFEIYVFINHILQVLDVNKQPIILVFFIKTSMFLQLFQSPKVIAYDFGNHKKPHQFHPVFLKQFLLISEAPSNCTIYLHHKHCKYHNPTNCIFKKFLFLSFYQFHSSCFSFRLLPKGYV